ncbi:site-specific integrase [Vogesella sp. XCS3]|uniref:site-specific integrase n=1 Tax=Vogesella sp. XCS3 TaxID=2877939 RepID=UPI001D09FA62|nr:site-specific integrase [Vogesella sp. XCS3]UDM18826.1 site-specific integrase [Vogesella sp. XCS3]
MDKNQKLKETLEHYRNRVSILKKGYAQERYRIEQLSRSSLGNLITREITSVDVATYRDQRLAQINPKTNKNISAATVRLEMSLLSNCLDIARIEWGVCDSNPVKNVKKPKTPPGRDRRLTAREERLILRYCHNHSNPELYSIVILALETAMRQGEILKLEWEHINLKTRIAHLPETKNGTKRDVPLSVRARDALIRLGAKTKGRALSYSSNGLKSTWRFMLIKLGIEDLHFHDLRHESISRLVELGTLDLLEVAAISGHKSLSMLKRYTHLRAQRLVRKLEGNKHKGKQAVLDNLIPYPASIEEHPTHIEVRLLDFEGLVMHAPSRENAIQAAQDTLLRKILTSMRDAKPIPQPDQYLDPVDEAKVVMIDPLASQYA